MARRSSQDDPEILRVELLDLIINYEQYLKSEVLRDKVISLIPVFHKLKDLGSSLIPKNIASSGRDRILKYLLQYPGVIVKGEELMVVSGINDYPRRVRELRRQFGWSIISGETAKEMYREGDFPLEEVDVLEMNTDDYILIHTNQDKEAAYRWNTANTIRKKKTGVKGKILEYIRENVGKVINGEELRYVANEATEWGRRVRELRTEEGWPIKTKNTGRPDLKVGEYILEEDKQDEEHDRHISDIVRVNVLERDSYCCRKCGWSYNLKRLGDPRHILELHHIKHHKFGGENDESNLITLCNVDHDYVHAKGKLWGEEEFYNWLNN